MKIIIGHLNMQMPSTYAIYNLKKYADHVVSKVYHHCVILPLANAYFLEITKQ